MQKHLLPIEDSRFPKAILNSSPRGKRKQDSGEICEAGMGSNAEITE